MKEKIGIIDLGTNTFHLLIAEVNGGTVSILHRERQAVKIGKGGINQGVVLDEAVHRALKCLKQFKSTLDKENVNTVMAIGTSALRSAANRDAILIAIKSATGIDVQIISGDQEAEYIYYGVRSAMDLGTDPSLIVDIGGGSVECIIANRDSFLWKKSFDIGAQRMLERFHRHDPILPEECVELKTHYNTSLTSLRKAMEHFKPRVLVGSSGTFDTLSEIHCHKNSIPYVPGQPESPLSLESFLSIHEDLVTRDRNARMQIPGMIEMRVDMIVVASFLIEYLVNSFAFEKIRVSSFSLKEGVLTSMTKI